MTFCYDCGEELLHNPVLLEEEILGLARLFEVRGAGEHDGKPDRSEKHAKRIVIFREVIAEGIRQVLARAQTKERTK